VQAARASAASAAAKAYGERAREAIFMWNINIQAGRWGRFPTMLALSR
jgi:hypothetical protein